MSAVSSHSPLLDLSGIEAAYGSVQALFGVSLQVRPREVVTLLGRNGMGKTTLVHAACGLVPARAGRVRVAGADVTAHAPHRIARAGIGLVPEGRQVFPNLTVRENLVATAHNQQGAEQPWTLERVYALFPRLAERQRHLGAHLSGGEQQMLAIGRALMTNPRLLILDEATEGLAPLIRGEIWKCLAQLKHSGLALVVIDKNIAPLLRLADRHHVIEKGRLVWAGTSDELQRQPEVLSTYLGV